MLDYKILDSIDEIEEEILSPCVVDLETTGLKTHKKHTRIVGVGLTWRKGQAVYIAMNDKIDTPAYMEELTKIQDRVMVNSRIKKRGHNFKYDARVWNAHGLKVDDVEYDSMIANYCMYGDRWTLGVVSGHSLDDVSMLQGNYIKIRTKNVIPRKSSKNKNPSMLDVSIEVCGIYCCEDTDQTFRNCEYLEQLLALPENAYAHRILHEIEMPALHAITRMECSGVQIDIHYLEKLAEKWEERKIHAIEHLSDLAGEPIEPSLNRNQIERIVYDELQAHLDLGVTPRKTKSGARSVDSATMELLQEHPFCAAYMDVKRLTKLISTYTTSITNSISDIDDKLHASFNQHKTATGRLSSSGPNLQNIPARSEDGKQIRKAFVSRFENGSIVAADWSQCELRIIAHLGHEEVLIDIFNRDGDAHIGVAAAINNIPEDEVTPEERSRCKTLNFGIMYGMQAQKLAVATGMTEGEAGAFIKRYLGRMKGIDRYRHNIEDQMNSRGYTETMFGRRRYISKIRSLDHWERKAAIREAGNHPVQGTNADIAKSAMAQFDRWLLETEMRSILILQVHDELVVDCPPEEVEGVKVKLVEIMETVLTLVVKLKCDAKDAKNWADAH